MRVLRVAQKVYPDVTGGGPYHVHALSRDQAAMGHDVTVLTVGDGPRRETRDGYTVVRCPSWGSLLGNDIAPGIGRYLRRRTEFDVVHAHSHLYFATNLAALARRVGGPPLAVTNHGLYSQTAPEWVFDAYLRTVGRLTFDSADLVFCYTDADRTRLRDAGVDSEVAVVPNGVDTGRFTPAGPTADAVAAGEFVVLFVGRLVEGKRPGDAIDALARLRKRVPEAALCVVGDGPLRADLERRAREHGLTDAVTFLGHVPYDEMPRLYRAADVLLLPSRAEGLPRSVLEAFASGVPAVTSDLPQIRTVTEAAGVTVEVGDVEGFAAALAALAGDEDRRERFAAAGRRLVETEHEWSGTVERTTARLERLVR